jgi:lipoprotein-anchoring transpeptidase ErfK/SrfK
VRTPASRASCVALALGVSLAAPAARGDVPAMLLPPWIGDGEVPPPSWAQSVVPRSVEPGSPTELVLFSEPSRASPRRGVSAQGASLPFFGARRGSGCSGSWWLVGPLAWTCSDDADLSAEVPAAPARVVGPGGLAADYAFVQSGGASAYASLDEAEEGEADQELEGGWAVAIVEQREKWARTTKGLWIGKQDLAAAHPSLFAGEKVAEGDLDFAWVLADHASVWASPSIKDKPKDVRVRFQVVHVHEQSGPMVRVTERASTDVGWMLSSDLARPHLAAMPAEIASQAVAHAQRERWIDVDTATQTLVAYEGPRPVYATLVSTGRGPADGGSATPLGVHRIWVKIVASDMANVQHEDREAHYSLEDVPYVQFFDNAVALHGTYWHGDFGHPRSHGCVNLSPRDASWLFDFTEPHLPAAWSAAYPAQIDAGTLVRVR